VIEQCQFRCPYCLPGSQNPFSPKASWLSLDQYDVLAQALTHIQLNKIRFTGGEPLLRADLCELVALWRRHFPQATFGLTTNGQKLRPMLKSLQAAGIQKLNVHLDTLDPRKYLKFMGKGDPLQIVETIEEARDIFEDVKINMVVQQGINDDELISFLDLSECLDVQVRFIELMNTGSARDHVQKTFMSGQSIVNRIRLSRAVRSIVRMSPSDPASLWQLEHTGQVFGLIASDTEPFCDSCDRLRLTVDGRLRGCLYEAGGIALGAAIKQGVERETLGHMVHLGVKNKKSFHPLVQIGNPGFSMAEIGG
jgi:cyclic pyranopterin phosphate synthase